MSRAIPSLEIVVLSADPALTLARHGLRAVSRTNPVDLMRELRTADLLVSGGGSILQDVTSSRSLWYYLGVIRLAQSLGTPVMLYANGLGPINRPVNRWLARRVLDRVALITVRGASSKKFLEELGVRRPRVVVTADSAFSLAPAPPERVAAIWAAEGLPAKGPRDTAAPSGLQREQAQGRVRTPETAFIGVSVRPWPGSEGLEQAVARAVDYVTQKLGYIPVFLPVHRDLDLPVVERIRAAMTAPSHVIQGSYSAEETVGLFGRFRWVLSLRLHPLIFAAVAGVPGLGLVYDPKVEEFLVQTGQEVVGRVGGTAAEDILLAVTRLEADYDRRVADLRRAVADLRARAALNNTLAAELLGYAGAPSEAPPGTPPGNPPATPPRTPPGTRPAS